VLEMVGPTRVDAVVTVNDDVVEPDADGVFRRNGHLDPGERHRDRRKCGVRRTGQLRRDCCLFAMKTINNAIQDHFGHEHQEEPGGTHG
jgi:hypothetical protein